MLDAKIRKATAGAKTLDTAMRLAYERYSGARGYTPEQFQATMAETAGPRPRRLVRRCREQHEGTRLHRGARLLRPALHAGGSRRPRAPRWAPSTRNDNGRLVVSLVRRGTPAHQAGVNVDDEILAIDDLRVRADGLVARMDQYKVGDRIRLLVARRDRLVTLDVTLAPEPGRPWRLQPTPDATAEQKARLEAWLGR